MPDYLDGLGDELGDLLTTYRYTQRGTPPSEGGPPFTIETHMEDALAVLDAFEIERAWAVGHSWGGHLALHLLVAHPERLLGVVAVDPLGALPDAFPELDANLREGLTPEEAERVDEIEASRRVGDVTEADVVERFALIWPQFFADPTKALPSPARMGVAASVETNRSIADHFGRGTLTEKLPAATLPLLVVHGEISALPLWSAVDTAGLVPGAQVVVVPEVGHFPWVEQPGSVHDAVEAFLTGRG